MSDEGVNEGVNEGVLGGVLGGVLEHGIECPYCGEPLEIQLDTSVPEQSYIEDCQVCCRPIVLHVSCDPHAGVSVQARHEDE